MGPRTLAVDWSGAVSGAEFKIWLAEAAEGELVRLECGRSRGGVAEHLIAEAGRTPNLVVGLDFAFSLPAWFLEERGLPDGPALWDLVTQEGESWLAACSPPFWGRPGRGRPSLPDDLRRTDREAPSVGGIRPKSVFQIGGAGAVGTGSLRGMPVLKQLRDAGFHVWPFDSPGWPLVVEIYPRLLTGPVNKGDAGARASYLAARFPALSDEILERAASSEDAFDAAVSALVMDAAREELARLTPVTDGQLRREGQIWAPAGGAWPSPPEATSGGGAGRAVAPSAEEWRALVRTMLPPPVREDEPDTLIGGDPGEVVVHLAPQVITVSRFGVQWNGHLPEPSHHEVARFDPRTATPRAVARAVVRARSARLGTYRWCTHCHETLPPEWMHGEAVCQGCAEKHLGVVY